MLGGFLGLPWRDSPASHQGFQGMQVQGTTFLPHYALESVGSG